MKFIKTVALVLGAGVIVGYGVYATEQEIAAHVETARQAGQQATPPRWDAARLAQLPAPVQRYLRFALPDTPEVLNFASYRMVGDFRRDLNGPAVPTTVTETAAVGTPALVYAGQMPLPLGMCARTYDAFNAGEMHMKAKILSVYTVVNERNTPDLNETSLRRWLLESPLYPAALLPGGPAARCAGRTWMTAAPAL